MKQIQQEQIAIRLYEQKAFGDAEALCKQLLSKNPKNLLALNINAAIKLHRQEFEPAENILRKAIRIRKDADAYFNLGLACSGQGKTDEAIAAYQNCLLIKDHANAAGNLANIFNKERNFVEAENLYRKAIRINPRYGFAWSNLGGLLVKIGRYSEAEPALRQAILLLPDLKISYGFLGEALERSSRQEEAITVYQTSREPGRIASLLRQQASWENLAKTDAAFLENPFPEHASAMPPWPASMMPGLSPQLHLEMGRRFALSEYGSVLESEPIPISTQGHPRLKIGYLSADFSNHATMHLLSGVLETHDPAVVEVHLFSYGPELDDAYTRRVDAMPLAFHQLRHLSDRLAAAEITSTRIDILVDLKGYTTHGRPGITALRPAPTIVSWLGYPGSLGHERLADFIIGDSVVTPAEHASHFSETIAMMPFCYQPNDTHRPRGITMTRAEVGLPETGIVFCCFNQIRKINPVDFDIWCKLLDQISQSVIWLLDPKDEGIRHNLRAEMQKRGISADRLIFAPFRPLADHIGRLRLADIFLDTQQYNAHTTASDALWAGVPVITRIGDLFASRVAASLLTAHGFPELITQNRQQYFELALELAQNPAKLRTLRARMAEALPHSPLFDTIGFTRDLERLYEAIWRDHTIPRNERKPIVLPR